MKAQVFVTTVCACLLAFPASAIDIIFKDGTVLKNATIYVPPSSIRSNGGPSAYGVNLTVNDKLYIHHYPYIPSGNIMKQVDADDDGIYETEIIKSPTLHYRPPLMFERAPNEFGYSCTPSRIPFIHFSNETLLKVNRDISMDPSIKSNCKNEVAKSIDGAIRHIPKPHELNTLQFSRRWQREADRDVARPRANVIYGKWNK
tara:strand:+ start:435 stop:1040 length:606 start_codon:yes stop_codon:yes gene_type:complete